MKNTRKREHENNVSEWFLLFLIAIIIFIGVDIEHLIKFFLAK